MNRILEFTASAEEEVVSRVLVRLHKAIDKHFPSAMQANRQFSKTLFSDREENTAIVRVPELPDPPQFASEVSTDPGIGSTDNDQVSTEAAKSAHQSFGSPTAQETSTDAGPTTRPTGTATDLPPSGVDFGLYALLAALIAGIIILVYVLYIPV